MKQILLGVLSVIILASPCRAETVYSVEILQVGNLLSFDQLCQSTVKGLEKHGFVEGKNLRVRRTVIDADAEAGLWEKVKILMKIKNAAGDIVSRKPDLVVTIGTPATQHSKDKILKAGIPLVFSGVAIPELVGCASKTKAGQGFTGVTIYMDPLDVIRISQLALPNMKKLGIIYSDDDNAIAYSEETAKKAPQLGIEVILKQISMSSSIAPAATELVSQGIDAFFIPIDKYYGIRNFKEAEDIARISYKNKVPCISSISGDTKGSLLYIAPDFHVIGDLTSNQVARILKDKTAPGDIPVIRQENLNIIVDLDASKKLGIELPLQILQLAKTI